MPSGMIDAAHMALNDHIAKKALQTLMRRARGVAAQTGTVQLGSNGVAVRVHQPYRHRPFMLLGVEINPFEQQSMIVVATLSALADPGERTEIWLGGPALLSACPTQAGYWCTLGGKARGRPRLKFGPKPSDCK
jgi:hypothetical protein